MNIYPALRSKMGTWEYYTVKMSASELSRNVLYASEVHEDRTLDEAIQRVLNKGRVKTEIVEYLKRQPNRFFSSIVVAALAGNPKFYNVEITDDPRFAIFKGDSRLNESFGVLHFDGTEKYYALDGQHRLAAIRTLLDKNDPISEDAPENFEDDELSVIVVVPSEFDTNESFMQKYRRLFSNLNRYAKPMDQSTNIIMDEDDTFAILTRRLISENSFFQSDVSGQNKSDRIKTTKGKNLKTKDTFFTSIETLYDMNISLLSTPQRIGEGWIPDAMKKVDLKNFRKYRPHEDYIDLLYEELSMYWNGLLEELPVLKSDPSKMRFHDITDIEDDEGTDHLLFWPIGQQMLSQIARQMLDSIFPGNITSASVKNALQGLNMLEWKLHRPPWRFFLLVGSEITSTNGVKWNMRNEQRTWAVRTGRRLQLWVLGLEPNDNKYVENLKNLWKSFLTPSQPDERTDEMWNQVVKMKEEISG